MATKTCRDCQIEKSLEEFGKFKGSKDGHWSYCKACCKVRDRKNREQNKQKNRRVNPYTASDGPKHKVCSACSQELPTTEFYREGVRADGLSYTCKTCHSQRRKQSRQQHKDSYRGRPDGTKVCPRCKQEKEAFAFTTLRSTPDGLRYNCKVCEAAAYNEIRLEVLRNYSEDQPKCKQCGLDEDAVLEIDHIEGGGGKHRQSLNGLPIYRWLKREGCPPGYQVLCANCHERKSRKQRSVASG